MDVPPHLTNLVREGNGVLLLGAGASLGSVNARGREAPTSGELSELLANRFLGGAHRDDGLAIVGEYAISETDLVTVQEFIRDQFSGLKPTAAHALLPAFSWRGLATTNYDRLIEDAYNAASDPLQRPRVWLKDGDRGIDDVRRDPTAVLLLKLHGCISLTDDPELPLILTPDQYLTHKRKRERLFRQFDEWASEFSVVFVGHSLSDPDLRQLINGVDERVPGRPHFYAVLKNADDIVRRRWETKRVTVIRGTFEEFLQSLDGAIPRGFRKIASLAGGGPASATTLLCRPGTSLPQGAMQFLELDTELVKSAGGVGELRARDFYRGDSQGWAAIEAGLDVRRHLADEVLTDSFLIEESEHAARMELLLVRAAAGAGKSVLLRRIAWDAAHEYGKQCLWLRPQGALEVGAVREVLSAVTGRLFLFIDSAGERVRELENLARRIGDAGKRLTVVIAERMNEWNISGSSLGPFVTREYELKNLSGKEIEGLLVLLERHGALGRLEAKTQEERRRAFEERAGRQLLVALHEATLGKPFEDIVEDEFRNVLPLEAQQFYLTVCVLNRLDVPVRAGVLSRIHGIPFEDFRARFFSPLEHVVVAEEEGSARDLVYRARHARIAEIVFERVLITEEERFESYVKCLGALNPDYSVDRRALRRMLRGRAVLDLFSNQDLAQRVFDLGERVAGEDPYVLHQRGIYEMSRPNGNLEVAADFLARAGRAAPSDATVKHSLAELCLRRADQARTALEQEKHLRDAEAMAKALTRSDFDDTYAFHTLTKVGIRRLRMMLAEGAETAEAAIDAVIRATEGYLYEGLQRAPMDDYLLAADAEWAAVIEDSERARKSLQRSFEANPRSPYVALRLAAQCSRAGETQKAIEVLEAAVEANPGEKRLRLALAKRLLDTPGKGHDVLYHLQRACQPGDRSNEARLLYGRQLFADGELEESKRVFRELSGAAASLEVRQRAVYPLPGMFRGTIARIEENYCFIARDGRSDWVFAARSGVERSSWVGFSVGNRVRFRIAFNFRGAAAFDIENEVSDQSQA
jgi:Flp pilus assembly protein TadD